MLIRGINTVDSSISRMLLSMGKGFTQPQLKFINDEKKTKINYYGTCFSNANNGK